MPSTTPKVPKVDSSVLNEHLPFLWLPLHSFEVPSAAYNGDSAQALTDSYVGGAAGTGGGWMLVKGW